MEAGLDSLAAVELRNQLSAHFNIDLAPTLSFDFPTAAALATHIASKTAALPVREVIAPLAEPGLSLAELEDEIQQIAAQVMGFSIDRHQVCLT